MLCCTVQLYIGVYMEQIGCSVVAMCSCISVCLYGASMLFCCYVALCSCISVCLYGASRRFCCCCTVQLSVRYATVTVCININTYLSGTIKLWMFLTAQGTGSFLVRYTVPYSTGYREFLRYTNGHTKLNILCIKEIFDYFSSIKK